MRYVPAVIIVLALIDAMLHFSVDAVVNKTFTNLPYGPLFVLLPLGYLALVVLLLRTRSATTATQQQVAAAFAVYAAIPLVAYFLLTGGRYNPFQIATMSKLIEIILIVISLLYVVSLGRQRTTGRVAVQS
jgi:hypothetical protein